jgi:hypothetical protein
MNDPALVAALDVLDRCIAEFEEHYTRKINEFTAAHAESSLSEVEDIQDDPELQLITMALNDLRLLRKKVVEGKPNA